MRGEKGGGAKTKQNEKKKRKKKTLSEQFQNLIGGKLDTPGMHVVACT
jgi:hypothetical protein